MFVSGCVDFLSLARRRARSSVILPRWIPPFNDSFCNLLHSLSPIVVVDLSLLTSSSSVLRQKLFIIFLNHQIEKLLIIIFFERVCN
jgi:hypothetical protein